MVAWFVIRRSGNENKRPTQGKRGGGWAAACRCLPLNLRRPGEGVYICEIKGIETGILHGSREEGEDGESEAKMNAISLPTDPCNDDGKESSIQNEERLPNLIEVHNGGPQAHGQQGDGDATTFDG